MSKSMNYVTDTHALVWYFIDDLRLGKKALEAFEQTTDEGIIIVPSIVLAEIIFISKKGRITLTFDETIKKIVEYKNFDIASLDSDILKIADKIEPDMEMHDKLIVATSLYFNASLITRDRRIKESGIVSTIW
jgi:PIN domain nuclease of toxin-antitoxin system